MFAMLPPCTPEECEMIVKAARGRRAGREADWHYTVLMFIILRF